MDTLLNPAKVRSRMVLGDKPGLNPLITSAIEAAQQKIASVLETDLQKVTGLVDVFYLDREAHSGIQRQGMYRCRLTRGFVLGTPTIEVMSTWNDSNADAAAIDATKMTWGTDGLERGVLSIEAASHHGKWIRVTYDSGFENPLIPAVGAYTTYTLAEASMVAFGSGYIDGVWQVYLDQAGTGFVASVTVTGGEIVNIGVNTPGVGVLNTSVIDMAQTPELVGGTGATFNLEFTLPVVVPAVAAYYDYDAVGMPDWLQEAILAYVPVVFDFGPKTKRDPEAEKGYKVSGEHAMAVLSTKTRKRVLMLNPL